MSSPPSINPNTSTISTYYHPDDPIPYSDNIIITNNPNQNIKLFSIPNEFKHITSLSVPKITIARPFPTFTNLTHLNISNLDTTITLPTTITSLTLSFKHNNTITNLNDLINLESLNLRNYNQQININNFPKLKYVASSGYPINNINVSSVHTNLKHYYSPKHEFRQRYDYLPNLVKISVGNVFTDINQWKRLTYLKYSNNYGPIISLHDLKSLKRFEPGDYNYSYDGVCGIKTLITPRLCDITLDKFPNLINCEGWVLSPNSIIINHEKLESLKLHAVGRAVIENLDGIKYLYVRSYNIFECLNIIKMSELRVLELDCIGSMMMDLNLDLYPRLEKIKGSGVMVKLMCGGENSLKEIDVSRILNDRDEIDIMCPGLKILDCKRDMGEDEGVNGDMDYDNDIGELDDEDVEN